MSFITTLHNSRNKYEIGISYYCHIFNSTFQILFATENSVKKNFDYINLNYLY